MKKEVFSVAVLFLAAVATPLGCSDKSKSASPCDGITCSGHGRCRIAEREAICECDPGFEADGLFCIDPNATVQTTDQILQYGIVWTFDAEAPYGQYANGDFWVVGPVTITSITPSFDGEHHGWEVNPADIVMQGFDSRIYDFDAARVPGLPYTAQPGQSIVKAVSLEPLSDADCRPCLSTATVLTVVAGPPADNGLTVFRPPYFGTDKPDYSTNDLNPALLPSYARTESAVSLAETADRFRRVQLDHKIQWTGRPMHPMENLPDYGSSISVRNAEGALALMLDDPVEEKTEALVMYVQYGIDLYHMTLNGVYWEAGGGHAEGRKLPVTFASVLLDNQAMQEAVTQAATHLFGENGGMYYSEAASTVLWGQTPNSEDSYWTNVVFDTGSRTIIDPYRYIDGGYRPGGSYQYCCTSMPYKLNATALYLMDELISVWNHDAFFDYVNRWVDLGAWTQPDPCAPADGVCAGGDNAGAACTSASEPGICTGDEAYCDLTVNYDAHYGVTYGPDGAGGCILDTDPSDGTGRFPALHGTSTDEGHYGSRFAEEMWDAYVNRP